MDWWLPILFGLAAFLYAMAGFGGGSTYTALLILVGTALPVVPVVSLICNLVVVCQAGARLGLAGWIRWRFLLPLLVTSVPAAFLAGAWRISASAFLVILASTLTLAGLVMWITQPADAELDQRVREPSGWLGRLGLGTVLGGLAGVTGIGGGIYLSPALHLLRWARAREIAAAAAVFILVNSIAGLAGQLSRGQVSWSELAPFLACPVAVAIGGFIGSTCMIRQLTPARIRRVTSVLVLFVALQLWVRVMGW